MRLLYNLKSNKCCFKKGSLLFLSLPNGRRLVPLLYSKVYFITISHNHVIIIFLTSSWQEVQRLTVRQNTSKNFPRERTKWLSQEMWFALSHVASHSASPTSDLRWPCPLSPTNTALEQKCSDLGDTANPLLVPMSSLEPSLPKTRGSHR